jgi:hypothetical protein
MIWCLKATDNDADKATEMANRILAETTQLVLDHWAEINALAQAEFEKQQ